MCPDLGLVGAFFLTEIPDFIRALFGSGASTEEGQPRFGGLSTDESMNGGGSGWAWRDKEPLHQLCLYGSPLPQAPRSTAPQTHTHTHGAVACLLKDAPELCGESPAVHSCM